MPSTQAPRFAAALLFAAAACASAQTIASTTFEDGDDGWYGLPLTAIDEDGGHPGAALRTPGWANFYFYFSNDSHPGFVGDYTAKGDLLEFSFDLKVNSITDGFGNPVAARPVIVEFIDYDLGDDFYPYSSVYFVLDYVPGSEGDWQTYSVRFAPGSTELPAGWGGTGDEDDFAVPHLPEGVTFADVMAGVDEVFINSSEPGFRYPEAFWDIAIDNIELRVVPTPAGGALLVAAAGLAGARRRR